MNIKKLLDETSIKTIDKRKQLVAALEENTISIEDFKSFSDPGEKNITLILETLEEVTRKKPELSTSAWLDYTQMFLVSPSNSQKREAARIIGNIAHLYPAKLNDIINTLLNNTEDKSTVIRWSSAYALSRIILIEKYTCSPLLDRIMELAEKENGVKQQYLKTLKKLKV